MASMAHHTDLYEAKIRQVEKDHPTMVTMSPQIDEKLTEPEIVTN
jgi:hypothetical protein